MNLVFVQTVCPSPLAQNKNLDFFYSPWKIYWFKLKFCNITKTLNRKSELKKIVVTVTILKNEVVLRYTVTI